MVVQSCFVYENTDVGAGRLVSKTTPGVFLQGLAVYSTKGELLRGPSLTTEVVLDVFGYASKQDIACVAFLGDTCVTLNLKKELEELHSVYYEPLAKVGGMDQSFMCIHCIKG